MKKKITHEWIENRLSGETEKAVWSTIRDSSCGEMTSKAIREKHGEGVYPAIEKLMGIRAIVKVQRGLYAVSEFVVR
jgi:hypothetical protein